MRPVGTRGQGLTEAALGIVLAVLLALGIIEFGFAFARLNMIVHAARDGARFAATLDPAFRTEEGCVVDAGKAAIRTHVTNQLSAIGFTASDVTVVQGCEGTVPTIRVTIAGSLDYIFNLFGTSLGVNRSATFEDEIRDCGVGGGTCLPKSPAACPPDPFATSDFGAARDAASVDGKSSLA